MNRPPQCFVCLVENRLKDLLKLGSSSDSLLLMLDALSRLSALERTEAFVESFEEVKKLTGVSDPYGPTKTRLMRAVAEVAPLLLEAAKGDGIRGLLGLAASANALDTRVLGYEFNEGSNLSDLLATPPLINDADEALLRRARTLAYVLDNHGEAVVDALVAAELSRLGLEVKVVARGSPYEIDVTYAEALELLGENIEVLSTGTPYPALYRRRAPRQVVEVLEGVDLVIAKGIANLEAYMDEPGWLRGKALFALRAKCPPIAEMFGVPRGSPLVASEHRVMELLERGPLSLVAISPGET
ncbi:MAG: ARMT1-like domain-containing protein [Fervidicoccaceae archaeon]